MPEQKQESKKPKNIKRARKWVWCAAIVIVIAAIICCLFWTVWKHKSVDEQLAAIEAARAIPDEENAAIIYNQLLEDYDESSLSLDFLDEDLDNLTSHEPWLSKDYPELAEWLKDQQDTISTLLQASKKEKCRFPIITDVQQMPVHMDQLWAMRRWAYLLIRTANNDIAEDRIDAVIQKYRCLIQIANHLYQQPVAIDFLVGILIDSIALRGMRSLIVESNLTEEHLRTIEAALPQTNDNWAEISSKIIEFETLYGRKNLRLFDRLKFAWWSIRIEHSFERTHIDYLRLLADRRGNRILIALRRYKNKHDHWPQTLSEIQSFVPAEILIDPYNNGSFVYKLTDNNFELYSKGLNNIDEDEDEDEDEDDWPIWPGPR